MKKYFIFALAAVAATAACTKVEVDENAAPDKKISFEVANYTRQTKANGSLANAEDQIYKFHTYAYQFPALGSPVEFMNVDVFPWSANANKVSDATTNIIEWSPVEDYYWPKTGYINFYSYAGTPALSSEDVNTTSDWKTVTFNYTNVTIDPTSNILVADPAVNKTSSGYDAGTYPVDAGESAATEEPAAEAIHVTKGVATLFHHMLTKIQFDVQLKTANTNSNIWKVEVLGSYTPTGGTEIKSQLIAKNQGSLTLTSTDQANWEPSIATVTDATSTAVLWVPTTEGTSENISLSSAEMTLAANATTSGDAITLLALRSVMPQLSSGVPLSLVYKVAAYHDSTKYLEEIRTVGISDATYLSALSSSTINWLPNKKITYHIVIDPVTEKVTFDPAVEDYSETVYNSGSAVDVDEDGITAL